MRLYLYYIFWLAWSVQAISIANYLNKYSKQQTFYQPELETIEREDFDVWIQQQKRISFQGILNNIGGISSNLGSREIPEGVVLASPSKHHPNYYYQWIRDSALTIRSLIYQLSDSNFADNRLRNTVEAYISNNYKIQRTPNLSGDFENLTGLGEPKFNFDFLPFNEKWGRPQRDGPGLRVSTIKAYLGLLEKFKAKPIREDLPSSKYIYQEIIKPDLKYILNFWNKPGFDLWEEVEGFHFFTSITQLRSLKDGIDLYHKYDGNDSSFLEQLKVNFNKLSEFIKSHSGYVTSNIPYIVENPELFKNNRRVGLDIATLLGALHAHSLENEENIELYKNIPYDIDDSHILNSLRGIVTDMRVRYPVNRFNRGVGVGLGRYPEDVYDGYGTSEGNPWFISTSSAAEVIYRILFKLYNDQADIIIDESNKEFYSKFIDYGQERENFTIKFGSDEFSKVSLNLFEYGDSFLAVVKDHVDNTGRMSEQFNRYDGYMQGAEDLSWSYSAVWNCIRWRTKLMDRMKELS